MENKDFEQFLNDIQDKSHKEMRKNFLNSDKFYNMSLEEKIKQAKQRIIEFYKKYGNQIEISFSGGKDSCVLKWLIEQALPNVYLKIVTATELFHPATFKFIQDLKKEYKGEWIIYPVKKNFIDIINLHGYPIISKQQARNLHSIKSAKNSRETIRHSLGLKGKSLFTLPMKYIHLIDNELCPYKVSELCCNYIKYAVKHNNNPAFLGTTIEESRLRRTNWVSKGCNIYDANKPQSRPLSLFTEKDIWDCIKTYNIKVSPIYEIGWNRSGCIVCMFGMSLEKMYSDRNPNYLNRFELLEKHNKKIFDIFVINEKYGLWKPLTDIGVKLRIDNEQYNALFQKRIEEIKNWYDNYENNMDKCLNEIEQRNPNVFNQEEKEKIKNNYRKSVNLWYKSMKKLK